MKNKICCLIPAYKQCVSEQPQNVRIRLSSFSVFKAEHGPVQASSTAVDALTSTEETPETLKFTAGFVTPEPFLATP